MNGNNVLEYHRGISLFMYDLPPFHSSTYDFLFFHFSTCDLLSYQRLSNDDNLLLSIYSCLMKILMIFNILLPIELLCTYPYLMKIFIILICCFQLFFLHMRYDGIFLLYLFLLGDHFHNF